MNKKRSFYLSTQHIVIYLLFALVSLWWLYIQSQSEPSDSLLELFSGSYGIIALVGSVFGIRIAKYWGGWKSIIGRSILLFSFGLLAQEFGQLSYSFYTIVFSEEIPYPSVGDIGYMGSVFLYIAAIFTLAKAVTAKKVLSSYSGKLQAILIPLLILIFSYVEFLRGYEFDWSSPLATILDFAYPLGQAIYISLALLVFLLSRKYLGGKIRPAILFLLSALILQYIADFTFLYQTSNETWTTAGVNDYMYAVAYTAMSLALLRFGVIFKNAFLIDKNLSMEENNA